MIEDGIEVMNGQEAFNEVVDLVLGDDYYIVDPLPNIQANPIILKDIKNKYNKLIRYLKITTFMAALNGILFITLLIYILFYI